MHGEGVPVTPVSMGGFWEDDAEAMRQRDRYVLGGKRRGPGVGQREIGWGESHKEGKTGGDWGKRRERQEKEGKTEGQERDGERQGWRRGSLDGDWE